MAYMNTDSRYGSVSKFLHWLIALMIITLLIVGTIMTQLPKTSPMRPSLYNAHKISGLITLSLVIIRILWAWINTKPHLPNMMSRIEAIGARSVQYLFYLFLLIMPISGWVMATAAGKAPVLLDTPFPAPFVTPSEALAGLAGTVHYTVAWTLLVLIILHVSGALKHHFIDKNDLLRTMLPEAWGGKRD